MSEGSSRIWCPRVYISSDIKSLFNESTSVPQENNISSLFTPSVALGSSNQTRADPDLLTESKICLGRALVYKEDSYIVIVLLNDWESESSEPQHPRHQLTSSQLENICVELQHRLSAVLSSSEKGLLSFVVLSLSTLTITLEGTKPSPPVRSNSSSQPAMKSNRSPVPTPTAEILDCVGFIYSNDCNGAFKVRHFSLTNLDFISLTNLNSHRL